MNDSLSIKLLYTTDVHGCFFPYDFIERKPCQGSMARFSSYVRRLRREYGRRLLLLDGGDCLQGQPACYYSNFVMPSKANVAAKVMNYLHYDAQTIGNHDIETGHAVYDKYVAEAHYAVLAANVIDTRTQQPYFQPYKIVEVGGARVALIGMLTAGIPFWLHESLWQGMEVKPIAETLAYWANYVRKVERAHVVVAMLHSGLEGGIVDERHPENEALCAAQSAADVDLILYGHDHQLRKDFVRNEKGKGVLMVNPSSNAHYAAEVTITLPKRGYVVRRGMQVDCRFVSINQQPIDEAFMQHFAVDFATIRKYVDQVIGTFATAIFTRDCFFGDAAFNDFIHEVQLDATQADISLNAPLKFDTAIRAGEVRMSDMFNLYTYENQLYTLRMTGREIKLLLEMSYGLWIETMHAADDHIMKMHQDAQGNWLWTNLAFDFETAAGIDYEVDVREPIGARVVIKSMSDGRPFDETASYKVAMNSYRGNGGGELLTRGAGIAFDELASRILWISERDQRQIIADYIRRRQHVEPRLLNNWRFVPQAWTEKAIARDRKLLFPSE